MTSHGSALFKSFGNLSIHLKSLLCSSYLCAGFTWYAIIQMTCMSQESSPFSSLQSDGLVEKNKMHSNLKLYQLEM